MSAGHALQTTAAANVAAAAARQLHTRGPNSEHQQPVELPGQDHLYGGSTPTPAAPSVSELPAGARGKASEAPMPGSEAPTQGFAIMGPPTLAGALARAATTSTTVPTTPTAAPVVRTLRQAAFSPKIHKP